MVDQAPPRPTPPWTSPFLLATISVINVDMLPSLLLKLSLTLCAALTLAGCAISHVMRVDDRQVIGVETMISELRDTPVVLLGERHDASSHHKLQLEVIKSLQARGTAFAIGMEMFETSGQKALDAWSAGKAPEFAIRKVFESSWRNIPWGLYEEILLFARDNNIPVIGLNAPRGIVQKVSQLGVSSLTSEDLLRIPPGINLEVSDSYLDFMAAAYPVHGRAGESFRYICEAQMLRNRVMARKISDYLAAHPESAVVVLAGGGHVRETGGIPAELGKLRHTVVLPAVPGLDAATVSKKDGDYLLEEPYLWLEAIF